MLTKPSFYERIFCHYWFFLKINFRFHSEVCKCCHDLMQKSMHFTDVANVSVNGNDYIIHVWCMSKWEAINLF